MFLRKPTQAPIMMPTAIPRPVVETQQVQSQGYDPNILPPLDSIPKEAMSIYDNSINGNRVLAEESTLNDSVQGLNQQELASYLVYNFGLILNPINSDREQKEIALYPHQEVQLKKVMDHLNRSDIKSYLDTSVTGTGKTFFISRLCQILGLPMCIVCPNNTMSIWEEIVQEYNLPYYFITSFDALSRTGKSSRKVLIEGRSKEYPLFSYVKAGEKKESRLDYYPLSFLYRMVANGPVAFIIDEAHRAKNDSNFSRCVVALTKFLRHYSPQSHIFAASATPFNAPENSINIMALLGLFDKKYTEYDASSKSIVAKEGYDQLVNRAYRINQHATDIVLRKSGPPKKTAEFVLIGFNLYRFVIKKEFVYAMPLPKIDVKYDIKEGYYRLEEMDDLIYVKAAQAIGNKIIKGKEAGGKQKGVVAGIANMVSYYEQGITRLLCSIIAQDYYNFPQSKIVGLVQRVEKPKTIETIVNYLAQYGIRVGVISGKQKDFERVAIRREFQQPNGNLRVVILTMETGAASISLHDTDGNWPRRMYVTPRFGAISMHQAAGRIYRVGVKSDCYARLVQSVEFPLTRVLNSLAVSSLTMSDSVSEGDDDGNEGMDDEYKGKIKLPGEYDWELSFLDTDSNNDIKWWSENILKIKEAAKKKKDEYMKQKADIQDQISVSPRFV